MRNFVPVGGACGILYFVTTIVAIALASTAGVTERDLEVGNVEKYLQGMADNQGMFVASMWLFNVSNVLLVAFAAGLYQVLSGYGPVMRVALIAVAGGAFSFLMETMMTIGVAEGIAPFYSVASGGDKAVLHSLALTLMEFRAHTALLGGVLVAVAALLFGVAVLRTQALPRWLGYAVLVAGVLGVVGGLTPLAGLFSVIRVLGLVGFIIWTLAAGTAMLRIRSVATAP